MTEKRIYRWKTVFVKKRKFQETAESRKKKNVMYTWDVKENVLGAMYIYDDFEMEKFRGYEISKNTLHPNSIEKWQFQTYIIRTRTHRITEMLKERKLDFQGESEKIDCRKSGKEKGKLFIRTRKKKIVYKGRKKVETK